MDFSLEWEDARLVLRKAILCTVPSLLIFVALACGERGEEFRRVLQHIEIIGRREVLVEENAANGDFDFKSHICTKNPAARGRLGFGYAFILRLERLTRMPAHHARIRHCLYAISMKML